MKKFILSVSLYLLSLAASAQSEVPTDTIHGISMDNYKIYDDGFILDMGMKIATMSVWVDILIIDGVPNPGTFKYKIFSAA